MKKIEFTKGKLYFFNDIGECNELGIIENGEITPKEDKEDKEFIRKIESYNGELTVDIKDKETIRKIKQLFKTDIQRKAERRYNKKSYRDFIRKKR